MKQQLRFKSRKGVLQRCNQVTSPKNSFTWSYVRSKRAQRTGSAQLEILCYTTVKRYYTLCTNKCCSLKNAKDRTWQKPPIQDLNIGHGFLMMPTAAVSMISFVFLTCPSLISIQDLRLQRIAPIKSNQLSLHVKPAGKREQVPESLTQILNTSKCGTWRPPSLRNKSPPCPTSKLPVSEHPLEVCKESQPAPDPAGWSCKAVLSTAGSQSLHAGFQEKNHVT